MDLQPGARVGSYEIVGLLGAGGMGEVYRARDTRLGREVALKALPASVSQDAERLARFDREARLLAALNHSGIGAIYGIEESERGPLLVLELVPGVTLEHRIARGALPFHEAVSICRQIADAVAFAHAHGVVHRDLKPANVKCTPDGRVRVLDFGLAKAVTAEPGAGGLEDATRTGGATREGTILGTPAYMSPEQARGQDVDRRSDIWSLGLILYEALAGSNPFQRGTSSDTLVAVLQQELDWSVVPASTPAPIRALLRRCLERDRDRRMHDMVDVRIELEEALTSAGETPVEAGSALRHVNARGFEIGAAAVVVLAAIFHLVVLPRLIEPLAALYAGVAMTLSLPLRVYLNADRWAGLLLAAVGLIWGVYSIAGRPFLARVRTKALLATAAAVVVSTLGGLWLVAEQAVVHAMRLGLGGRAQLMTRDLASLQIAAGQPALAVALMDPGHTRDYPVGELVGWNAPGNVFQLAEAYRALGDVEAARRLYGRALEAATVFDETLSERVLAEQASWQAQSGADLTMWSPTVTQLRSLPDVLRTVARERLRQLGEEQPAGGKVAAPAPN